MLYPSDRNIHRPTHVYQDDTFYFITAKTFKEIKFFNTDKKKKLLIKTLKDTLEKYNFQLYTWMIADNHYHDIIKVAKGEDLKFFIKDLHSVSSKNLNKLENQKGRKVWCQYWDRCIRDEKDFYCRFNYIHHNSVKHKYVGNQNEVLGYKFCSYRQWAEKKGSEWMADCFERYPIKDFTVEGDDFLDDKK